MSFSDDFWSWLSGGAIAAVHAERERRVQLVAEGERSHSESWLHSGESSGVD